MLDSGTGLLIIKLPELELCEDEEGETHLPKQT